MQAKPSSSRHGFCSFSRFSLLFPPLATRLSSSFRRPITQRSAVQNPAGRAAYLRVSSRCNSPAWTLATRRANKKRRRIVNVDQQERRKSHGFLYGLGLFRRLTVFCSTQPCASRDAPQHYCIASTRGLVHFFFPTQPHSPQRLALRLSKPRDLAREKGIAAAQSKCKKTGKLGASISGRKRTRFIPEPC